MLAVCAVGLLLPASVRAQSEQEAPIKIGMGVSLFRDVPESLMMAMMKPFGALMKSQTGMDGDIIPGGETFDVAKALLENKLDIAVFHGIEFAWVKQKYPQLEPLMIAVNQEKHFRVHLVVRDGGPKCLADLKGAKIAMPKGSREHSRLFLTKHCQGLGCEPEAFFQKITVPGNFEDALDDVVDDEIQAVVVENVPFDAFARRKPGRAAKLKSLVISELFPSGVIAYNPVRLSEETLEKFRNGMLNANKNIMGRQMLMMFKLTCFEPVPADYNTILNDIVKHYPVPAVAEATISAKPIAPAADAKPAAKPEPVPAPKTPAAEEAPAEPAATPAEPEATTPAEPEPTPATPETPEESDPE
jgi:ABC-type phosphate/phosphonate transport system substrate-binding protein